MRLSKVINNIQAHSNPFDPINTQMFLEKCLKDLSEINVPRSFQLGENQSQTFSTHLANNLDISTLKNVMKSLIETR